MIVRRNKPEPCPDPVIDMDTTAMSPLIKIRLAEACRVVAESRTEQATRKQESGDYVSASINALLAQSFYELGTAIAKG